MKNWAESGSRWATVCVSHREGPEHLCVEDSMSFEFHATEADARAELHDKIKNGSPMVALLQVDGVFAAKTIEIERV